MSTWVYDKREAKTRLLAGMAKDFCHQCRDGYPIVRNDTHNIFQHLSADSDDLRIWCGASDLYRQLESLGVQTIDEMQALAQQTSELEDRAIVYIRNEEWRRDSTDRLSRYIKRSNIKIDVVHKYTEDRELAASCSRQSYASLKEWVKEHHTEEFNRK